MFQEKTCEANTRQAIIYGGNSVVGNISVANSVTGRLVSLLQYLNTQHPGAGWASFPQDGAGFEELMRVADKRMYRNKSRRRESDRPTLA